MTVIITAERPDTADGLALIDELELYFTDVYGGEGYGQSAAEMIANDVVFFVLREDGEAAGCGGVKLVGDEYSELMRVFVRPQYRGKGYGGMIVEHLEAYTRDHGIDIVRLGTGIRQPEAHAMYARMGYQHISPFGDHTDVELSMYLEKTFVPSGTGI